MDERTFVELVMLPFHDILHFFFLYPGNLKAKVNRRRRRIRMQEIHQ